MRWCVRTKLYFIVFLLILVVRLSQGSYDCLCNYVEESSVFPEPDSSYPPIGYLYEFDCKPLSSPHQTESGYFIIQYDHQIGFMQPDTSSNLVVQICSGSVPKEDKVTMAGYITDQYVTTVTSDLDVSTNPSVTTTTDVITTQSLSSLSLPSATTSSPSSSLSPSSATTLAITTTAQSSSPRLSTVATIESTDASLAEISLYTKQTQSSTAFIDLINSTANSVLSIENSTSISSSIAPTTASQHTSQAMESSTHSAAVSMSSRPKTSLPQMITLPSSFIKESNETGTDKSSETTNSAKPLPYVTSTTSEIIVTSSMKENSHLSEVTSFPSSLPVHSTESFMTSMDSVSSTGFGLISSTHPSKTSTIPSTRSTITSTTSAIVTTMVTTTEIPETTTQAPLTWPSGTYGLMEPVSGCPDDGYVTWSEGWRFQDTEGLIPFVSDGNTYSNGIAHYIKGSFLHNDIKTFFCMKTRHDTNQYDHDWPQGSYCILKYRSCPKGFSSGSIFWDDVVLGNNNDKGGTLPEGEYGEETTIHYCCRNDGSANTPIVLPTSRPFILLRYGAGCQSVQDMKVTDIFIHWDDQNLFNSDKASGMHPYDDGDGSNHRLHFCHYD